MQNLNTQIVARYTLIVCFLFEQLTLVTDSCVLESTYIKTLPLTMQWTMLYKILQMNWIFQICLLASF